MNLIKTFFSENKVFDDFLIEVIKDYSESEFIKNSNKCYFGHIKSLFDSLLD